jgi:hypothetical protein
LVNGERPVTRRAFPLLDDVIDPIDRAEVLVVGTTSETATIVPRSRRPIVTIVNPIPASV